MQTAGVYLPIDRLRALAADFAAAWASGEALPLDEAAAALLAWEPPWPAQPIDPRDPINRVLDWLP